MMVHFMVCLDSKHGKTTPVFNNYANLIDWIVTNRNTFFDKDTIAILEEMYEEDDPIVKEALFPTFEEYFKTYMVIKDGIGIYKIFFKEVEDVGT
jgi:hypothetical protein